MGRYVVEYWDTNFIKTPFSEECYWECQITDTKTGVIGICSSRHSSKAKAYKDAREDLMDNQREYYSKQNDKDSDENRNSGPFLRNTSGNSSQKTQGAKEWVYSSPNYSSDYSSNYSPNYTQNTSKNSGDSTLSIIFGSIIFIIIGAIIFENTCRNNDSKKNGLTHVESSNPKEDNSNTSDIENLKLREEKRDRLNGTWVKVEDMNFGKKEIGLVISFANGVGTVISVPENSGYQTGQIKWQNFDPDKNWIEDYFTLGDGYVNKEIQFKDSKTINLFGDIYKRR